MSQIISNPWVTPSICFTTVDERLDSDGLQERITKDESEWTEIIIPKERCTVRV